MPYSKAVEQSIDEVLRSGVVLVKKRMFGGICYLMNGNMVCGVYKDYLFLRLGEQRAGEVLQQAHVRPFDVTGRPMKGWVMLAGPGFAGDGVLKKWLSDAMLSFDTLPAK